MDKIKKQWLISFYMFALVAVILVFTEDTVSECAYSFLKTALWLSLTYYFAYKKEGTAWLMWVMISTPIKELIDINNSPDGTFSDPGVATIFAVILSLEVYFLVNCYRLRRLNLTKINYKQPKPQCP